MSTDHEQEKREMFNEHLTLAAQPSTNPKSLEELAQHASYTITPIDHDYPGKTPVMWNTLYREFGIDAAMAMVVGDPKQVGPVIASLRSDPKYRGGGSGSGFKEVVIPELDRVTELAGAIGAVNVIKREADGTLTGDNTDGDGYAESLEEVFRAQERSLKGAHVLMLGAGGTGRAIAFALAKRGVSLTILNRTERRALELAEQVNAHFGHAVAVGGGRERIPEMLPSAHAVVSVIDDATSPLDQYSTIGEMPLPVTTDTIRENRDTTAALLMRAQAGLIVSDIRLRRFETAMLQQARELGFPVLDGVPMVIHQGVKAFWWLYGELLAQQGYTTQDVARIMREAAR